MWKRRKTEPAVPRDPKDATREALDHCFEDVSSLHMIGAAPLSDLYAGSGPAAPASTGGPAEQRGGSQRWNLVALAVLLLGLAAATAVMLLGH